MKMRVLVAAAVGLTLVACGGGGGGVSRSPVSNEPPPEAASQPLEPGSGAQQPSQPAPPSTTSVDSETRNTLQALLRASDTVTWADTIDGAAFFWRATVTVTPANLQLSDLMKRDDGEFQSAGSRRGVSNAVVQERASIDYGGWLDHSFFFVNVWNPVSSDPLRPSESTFTEVYSVGAASGSNPISGSAAWKGVMAGIDEDKNAATFGNLVTGDARVSIDDFNRPAVGISLTNIRDSSTGGSHSEISWHDVSLSGGSFSTSNLSGRFYGPDHEEVGGIFLRNQINGAFGAKRQ